MYGAVYPQGSVACYQLCQLDVRVPMGDGANGKMVPTGDGANGQNGACCGLCIMAHVLFALMMMDMAAP